ncbi:MAG TPA: efflux RND transporter periplasmic adaptor subunit [Gemmatimonadales bacterium]|nr:efflux RND transporter periplasmic adaptor subunit [Gemmatimonadales bacterium]
MTRPDLALVCAALSVVAAACQKAEPAPLYEKVPVEHRDVVVTATALGVIQPILTFSVKSKAWGEILEMPVQTGDAVKKGQLLARIDPRIPQNNLAQAQAALDKARAQLANATAQLQRSEALFHSQAIAETDYDGAKLAFATAQAAVVTAGANLQTAQDAMEDTQVRAPIAGTVLALNAVLGTVISSPTLGGGTVILKMASLDTVQDSALVLETDVGRVQPGMAATVTVDAYPNRTFAGTVRKIEPQAQVIQNVTMFPVLVTIPNPQGLLKPGMNTEVRIHTGQRQGVLAIPNAALRTQRDVASAASILGLDPQVVQEQLAAAQRTDTVGGADSAAARASSPPGAAPGRGPATFTTPSGRVITLPPGVTPEQVRAAIATRMSGGQPSPAERALLAQVFAQSSKPGAGGPPRTPGAGSYIVFALRGGRIVAVPIRAGLTDQDHIEVRSGLTADDTVLVLPSASLVQAQQQFRQRFQNVTGGGLPGLRQQQPQGAARR